MYFQFTPLEQYLNALFYLEKGNLKNYQLVYINSAKILMSLINEDICHILGTDETAMFDELKKFSNNDNSFIQELAKCIKLKEILEKMSFDKNAEFLGDYSIEDIVEHVNSYISVHSFVTQYTRY